MQDTFILRNYTKLGVIYSGKFVGEIDLFKITNIVHMFGSVKKSGLEKPLCYFTKRNETLVPKILILKMIQSCQLRQIPPI